MKYLLIIILGLFLTVSCNKNTDDTTTDENPDNNTSDLYFPTVSGGSWETITPSELDWDLPALEDLKDFLQATNTRTFLVLKDGKIVVEEYWNKTLLGTAFQQNSQWYWASAGKSVTAFLVGQAQNDGYLDIHNPSSVYLGAGWTSLDKTREDLITVWHQLTMTTGLDDSGNADCTDPECLTFLAEPGTRWAYHNAPYTLLDGVIEGATGQSFDNYFNSRLRDPIGMNGFWSYLDYNHVYFSDARSMARYGILVLNEGVWDDEVILDDKGYLNDMVNTSQDLNKSYGYLWWLNGQSSVMIPGLQATFNRSLTTTAPADMYAAMGKNGQLLNIVPSENLIVVRMGDNPDFSLVPVDYQEEIWEKLNAVIYQ